MNTRETLAKEIAVIPPTARVIAAIVYCLGAAGLFWLLTRNPADPPWADGVKVVFALFMPLPMACYVLAIGYVNGDARRRNMRYVLWTLLAIFVPNMIGILLYFLLRDPMPVYCHKCGAATRPGFAHCPQCGAQLGMACPSCGKPVENGWANCAFCGARLA